MTNHEHLVNQALTKFPKAKRIAVENVTHGVFPRHQDMAWNMNFEADKAAYNWNAHTVNAIKWVIKNNVEETMAGAMACRNRSFVLPIQQITSVPE